MKEPFALREQRLAAIASLLEGPRCWGCLSVQLGAPLPQVGAGVGGRRVLIPF